MARIFVFSEDAALAKQLLTPALELKKALGHPITALTVSEAAAQDLAAVGADKAVALKAPNGYVEGLSETVARLVAEEGGQVLLVGATQRGRQVAAHVAAKMGAAMTTDAKSFRMEEGKLVTSRLLYAGLAVSEEALELPAVATVPARAFPAPGVTGTVGAIEAVAAEAEARVVISEVTPISGSGVDITSATKLVSVGRGFKKQEDLKLAEDLARTLGGELACTRGIAEDQHWLPIERYIGISGKNVKPELYLAVGLSGQVQHMVGARESKVIVAINNDQRSPIFEYADYGIVGDLYEVLPQLTAALKG